MKIWIAFLTLSACALVPRTVPLPAPASMPAAPDVAAGFAPGFAGQAAALAVGQPAPFEGVEVDRMAEADISARLHWLRDESGREYVLGRVEGAMSLAEANRRILESRRLLLPVFAGVLATGVLAGLILGLELAR